jgi:hypothetical protein
MKEACHHHQVSQHLSTQDELTWFKLRFKILKSILLFWNFDE